ncbi:MAG: 16S rRNA (guanine(527)-N(7))-methyltransferase RsmG [Actinobacteria bacterium]|nr:16S rRNA (guanine(527)-N(7))-methyltransferase RsmG [Actinomycetota bacterium]
MTPAAAVFGDRLEVAEDYARLLANDGLVRGLLGPREADRIWDRHLLNSAVLTDLLPTEAFVVDVGSGAGLPGIPMAIRRPDLSLVLVEPLLRRSDFLEEAVLRLGLESQVRVIRGRAEEKPVRDELGPVDWVTARAVAPLDRLVRWCLPLLRPGGRLLALKGARAEEEVATHRAAVNRLGGDPIDVIQLGGEVLAEPTWVVGVTRTGHCSRPNAQKGWR